MKSGRHHKTTLVDPTHKHVQLVSKWAAKWERANQIGEDVINFVCTVLMLNQVISQASLNPIRRDAHCV